MLLDRVIQPLRSITPRAADLCSPRARASRGFGGGRCNAQRAGALGWAQPRAISCRRSAISFCTSAIGSGLSPGEAESALRPGVSLKLLCQLPEDRSAERQIAEVIVERHEARDDPAANSERRNAVGDPLLGLRNDVQDRVAQRLEGAALGLIDTPQVTRQPLRWTRLRGLGTRNVADNRPEQPSDVCFVANAGISDRPDALCRSSALGS